MKIFKERKWIRSGLIVFFVAGGVLFLLPLTMAFHSQRYGFAEMQLLVRLVRGISTVYLFVTLLFVHSRVIRKYCWCFVALMILGLLIGYFGPILYDDFGYRWLLVNEDMIFYFPFLATLILFVEVFNLSQPQNKSTNNEAETTD